MQDRGWIDLHSHVLPQLDDGSESVGMSVAMLRRMAEQGISTAAEKLAFVNLNKK